MSEQAEKLVLDYLSRVGDIARGSMRGDQRVDFLRRLRARIEEMRASSDGAAEPEQVRKVLARFGDPGALVMRERQRLERESASGMEPEPVSASGAEPGDAGSPAGAPSDSRSRGAPAAGTDHGDTASRPSSSRGDGGGEGGASGGGSGEGMDSDPNTQPIPVIRAARRDRGAESGRKQSERDQRSEREEREGTSWDETRPEEASATGGSPRHEDVRRTPRPAGPRALPRSSGPPLYDPRSTADARESAPSAPSAVSRLVDQLPPDLRSILLGGLVEWVAIALLGVGGILAPRPVWFIGAGIAILAPGWSLGEKVIGLLPAPALALLGAAVVAGGNLGAGWASYGHALSDVGWGLFRVGAVLGAIYLVVRMAIRAQRRRRGLRWQQTRSGQSE